MEGATLRRATIVTGLTAAGLLLLTALAFACVPQRGRMDLNNNDTGTDPRFDTEVNASADSGSTDWIVGDGDPTTDHFESWCGDEGGHPVEAVWAHDGDELKVEVQAATADEVAAGCPDSDNKLPTAGDGTGDNTWIYLENGDNNPDDEANVYEWDETNNPGGHYDDGFWNFDKGPGKGCYPDDRDPINQNPNGGASFRVDSNGDGTHTFDLIAAKTNDFDGSPGNPDPGDGASVLCVGDETVENNGEKAIFAPVVVMQL